MSRKYLISLLLLLPAAFPSCEPEDWDPDVTCIECYGSKLDSANLIVYVTINEENPFVPLTFYRGSVEGDVDWVDTAYEAEFRLYSEMDRRYSVRAQYRRGTDLVEAFDEDNMLMKDYSGQCGSPCYIIRGGIFDLTLAE